MIWLSTKEKSLSALRLFSLVLNQIMVFTYVEYKIDILSFYNG